MQQQQPHHTLRRSGSVPPRGPSASFLTSYPLPAETRNKVLAVESSRARTALEKAGIETLAAAGIDQIALREFHDEICAAQSEKLELYMRSRWATVLFALRETLKKRTAATTKRELMDMFISTLKEKVKEKIVFEMMNPSLAKIMRSKTPPADAPRKIREEYRKAHPEEADNFPEIVLQLSKVHMVGKSVPEAKKEDPATKSAAPILEKSKKQEPEEKKGAATQKHIFGHEEKKQAMVKFPYRSTQENPKMKKFQDVVLPTHDADMLKWKEEHKISPEKKVFCVTGGYPDMKAALEHRGWVENPDQDSDFFDFKWTLRQREVKYDRLQEHQRVNHFRKNGELSTKVGLLHNVKNLVWYRGVDVDTFQPNSYDLADVEVPDFVEEFKVTKAEAVLRTHLIKKRSVKEEGVGKLILAMCITERRLMSFAQLLNSSVPTEGLVSVDEWEVLSAHKMQESKILKERHQGLKKRIDALYAKYRAEYAEIKDEDKAIEAKIADLLHRLKARYPQYELNGNRNIWIVKPAGLSRGRGIHMFWDLKKLTEFIRGKHYVVQKYIENPLIILNRKFDIRQWVLVTSWNPLTIWIYGEMYVRFGAEDYDMDMIGNKFMHLTNNSITKHCTMEHKIKGNMWTQEEFVRYIKDAYKPGMWENKIRPLMNKAIVASLKSTEDMVVHREGSFEMFGYDLMIDVDLKPWLIEVNCSPALDYSTEVTERLVKMVLEDLTKVVVDYGTAPEEKKVSVPTGNWAKVYQGSKKAPQHNLAMSFACKKMQTLKIN